MNPYTAELEKLDTKRGYVHTVEDWKRVGEKSPADLTAEDVIIIGHFSGPAAAHEAMARRAAALNPTPTPPAAAPKAARKSSGHSDALLTAVTRTVEQLLAPIQKQVAEMRVVYDEDELQVLKAKAANPFYELAVNGGTEHVRYHGPWTAGTVYARWAIVEHDGSVYLMRAEGSKSRPGEPGSGWELAEPPERQE